ncbi:MAG: nicotinate (nicotinamide) nucleotide adenylyltransferase [Acidobacteriales bacterium]|nr:nicotinate (nicotinamide) nucleotide adenylyltransferase [Terriglobales bacterium]
MNLALFGGTFDPIHHGHMAVARAALADPRFALDHVEFVLADRNPLKSDWPITSFEHRWAMLTLALEGEPRMKANDMERLPPESKLANYTIDTVRQLRKTLAPGDRLYFLAGIDSFLHIRSWKEPERLLRECRFIVVSRAGATLQEAIAVLPPGTPADRVALLDGVNVPVSATRIRQAARAGEPLGPYVAPKVAEYIRRRRVYA